MTNCMTSDDALNGFSEAGIARGDTVLLHSALRPFGCVQGGAQTIADALLRIIGPEGTLAAPAFCFRHEIESNPIIDPENDASEMGAVSEAIRRLPGVLHTTAYRHGFSLLGREARFLAAVDPALPVFDMRSVFGRMLSLDTKVVLAGVTYINSTSHHFGEYLLRVPDRQVLMRQARLRRPGCDLLPITLADYQPIPSPNGDYYTHEHDFNKLGLWLEQEGKVRISVAGNAVIRVFSMRSLIDSILWRYPKDQWIFNMDEKMTVLPFGKTASRDYTDGAGRPDTAIWSCVDPEKIYGSSNRTV